MHFLNLSLSLLTTSDDPKIRMQSLRLLINLSTNENMVKHLLTSKVSNRNIILRFHKVCNLDWLLYKYQSCFYLGFQVCNRLWDLIELDAGLAEDELLRVVTLLSNVVTTGQKLQLSSDLFSSLDEEDDDITGDEL